jgi:hypothetical protein
MSGADETNQQKDSSLKRWKWLPPPSMAVALGAIVLSVGGNVTAAVLITSAQIKDDTIRSVDVRDDAIKGIDVANNSLTGADVHEPTLGMVPSAANAATLDGLSADQLARATNAAFVGDPSFDTCPWTPLHTAVVPAPTDGHLLLWSTVRARRGTDPAGDDLAAIRIRLVVDRAVATVSSVAVLDDPDPRPLDLHGAVDVTAGDHNVALQSSECGPGFAHLSNGSLTTLFVATPPERGN